MSFDELLSAGKLDISTVADPGAQGDGVFGMHGIGVSVPQAAAVAAATVGFAILLHIPKGIMLSIGLLSIIVAAGIDAVFVVVGLSMSVEGAAPKAHCSDAPLQTHTPIFKLLHQGYLSLNIALNEKYTSSADREPLG